MADHLGQLLRRARFRPARLQTYVWVLAALGAASWFLIDHRRAALFDPPLYLQWWMVAVAFCLAEAFALHVHFRSETHTISLSEVGIVLGLFFLPPSQLILAQLVGSSIALVFKRGQRSLKMVFNLGSFALSTSLAVFVFRTLIDSGDIFTPTAWLAAVLACVTSSLVGVALVSHAIFLAEGEWSGMATVRTGAVSIAATIATASLVLALVLLISHNTWSGVVLLPPVAALLLLFRSRMLQARKHEHLTFLYESMAATQSAPDFGVAISRLMDALRELVRADYAEILLILPDEERSLSSATGLGSDRLMEAAPLTEDELRVVGCVTSDGGARLVGRGDAPGPLSGFLVARGLPDAILATLTDDGRVFGLMIAGKRSGDVATFTADELTLMKTFAGHASVLLENGRLEKTLEDVSALQEQLHHLAYHDPLTGLPNRTSFLEQVTRALEDTESSIPSVLFLDIDDFKTINDSHGHAVGDALLVALAGKLRQVVHREGLTASRLGGDEFAVLILDSSTNQPHDVAAAVLRSFARPVTVESRRFTISPSIGCASAQPGMTADELLRNADVAMYQAKKKGKSRYAAFEPWMYEDVRAGHDLTEDLRDALVRDEIEPMFQPIVRLADGEIVAFEALARWRHPERGVLGPAEFLPIAEQAGLLGAVDEIVLAKASASLGDWRVRFGSYGKLGLNINISPDDLRDGEVSRKLEASAGVHALGLSMLTLEITEAAVTSDGAIAIERARSLVQRGLRLAIDDFGTGHSSLARLEEFPLHTIKIARPFVERLADRSPNTSFVSAILEIAQAVGADTVAEGVETEAQAMALARLGCRFAQGYFYARPLWADEAEALLASRARLPLAA